MNLIESAVKELGGNSVSLHVFGFNKAAIHLYQKCGYEITNYNMRKKFEP